MESTKNENNENKCNSNIFLKNINLHIKKAQNINQAEISSSKFIKLIKRKSPLGSQKNKIH